MKKTVVIFTLLFALLSGTNAQDYDNSVGLALGSPIGLQYKGKLFNDNVLDVVVGTNYSGFSLTGAYEWYFPIQLSNWYWFVGPSTSLGLWNEKEKDGFFLAIYAGGGIEYNFETLPLAISVDFFPIGISFFEYSGYDFQSRLGIRYTF